MQIVQHAFDDAAASQALSQLLERIFVGEGYTSAEASFMFEPRHLMHRGDCWAAYSDGQLVGAAFLVHPDNPAIQIPAMAIPEVHLLAVTPEARQQGIAEALMNTVIHAAAELGYRAILLSSQPSMTAAHRLYAKVGFERVPELDWERVQGKVFWAFRRALNPA